MPNKKLPIMAAWSILFCFLTCLILRAEPDPRPTRDEMAVIASSLKWQTGTITLKEGLAKINLSDTFRFLDREDAAKVLHDLWGNPKDPAILGMIFPSNLGPLDHRSWAVVVEYDAGGYVKDDDAGKINYTDLLKQMQKEIADGNAEREKEGYPMSNSSAGPLRPTTIRPPTSSSGPRTLSSATQAKTPLITTSGCWDGAASWS